MGNKQIKYTFWHKQEIITTNLQKAEKLRKTTPLELDSIAVEEIKPQELTPAFGFQTPDNKQINN